MPTARRGSVLVEPAGVSAESRWYVRQVRLAVAPLGLAMVAGLLAGCGGDEGGGSDAATLEGVPWVVTAGIDVEGWEQAAPSMLFEDGRVSGSTGCNRYGGPYTNDGSTLELGELARTLRACPPPAGEVEAAFVAALERVGGWRVDGDELRLLHADDEELLRLGPGRPVGSWEATGVLQGDAFRSPIAGTVLTATFAEPDALRGSAGCNTYRATYTSDRGAIEISAPAATRKACLEPEGVMEQETAFLAALESAARYRVDGGTLELVREDGTSVVHFTRG